MKKMKKLIPATMAGAMIFGMGTPAFAAGAVEGDSVNDEVIYEGNEDGSLDATVPIDGRINRSIIDINPDPGPDDIISAQVSTEAVMWWVPSQDGQSYQWLNGLNRNRSDLDTLDPDDYNGYRQWNGVSGSLHGGNTYQGQVYSPDYLITNIGTSELNVDLVGFFDGNRFSSNTLGPNQLQTGTRENDEYGNLDLWLLGLNVDGDADFPLVISDATAETLGGGATAGAVEDVELQLSSEDGGYILGPKFDSDGEIITDGDYDNVWRFAIGGKYTGRFHGEELQFDHSMVLNFSIPQIAAR